MSYTVTITGVTPDPEVYGGLTKATAYIGAAFSREAAKWRVLSTDDKGRTLVAATRYIDARSWDGDAMLSGTVLQFPRSGGDLEDNAATQLAFVEQATFELAMAIAADPTIQTAIDGSSNVKVLDADGAKIEFFAPTSVKDGTATSMPTLVMRLLGRYTAAGSAGPVVTGGASWGTDGEPAFDDCDATARTGAF